MTIFKNIFFASTISIVALSAVSTVAHAENYPSKLIRFVAPIPPGGSTDVLAREVAQQLQKRLGQPVVVENRPGASGSIGTAAVAAAPADGYTILLINSSHSINPHVYKALPYDAIKDFEPVSLMTDLPMGLFVNAKVPAANLSEFLALAKSKPGGLSFASSGNGGASHLTGEMFLQESGTKMVHIPYRGSAPALNDVIAGQVPVLFADVPLTGPHVKSGALRAIAITSKERSPSMPDVVTFNEAGMKNMNLSIWIGVVAPKGTPTKIVQKLSHEIAEILKEPDMAEKVRARGFNIVGSTPDEFAKVIRDDYKKYGEVVRNAGIKAE
ncbi:tripartite tricarboxylate transporter substrate binding protein [Alcaligenaceae bacterium]|nr:tripartite tricarboxylate transporter substrate binding protein [Alcaligenaceae bacterium]